MEWEEVQLVEPFGEPWKRTALIAQTIANSNRGRKRAPFKVMDFMPPGTVERRKARQTVAESKAAFLAAIKGDVPDRGKKKRR